jgi:hypothetical protein
MYLSLSHKKKKKKNASSSTCHGSRCVHIWHYIYTNTHMGRFVLLFIGLLRNVANFSN